MHFFNYRSKISGNFVIVTENGTILLLLLLFFEVVRVSNCPRVLGYGTNVSAFSLNPVWTSD